MIKKFYTKLPPKFRLYLPIVGGVIITVALMTLYSVNKLQQNVFDSIKRNMSLEVQTVKKMFEREHDLKLDKVKTDMKVAHEIFYAKELKFSNDTVQVKITNQLTGNSHKAAIFNWKWDGQPIWSDSVFVDKVYELVGGTSTIFQKTDSGYVRISTNVQTAGNKRAFGTFIPNQSVVVKTVEQGKTYIGRAFVVNDWYITAYEPIYNRDKVVGMLYVGDKEKDLSELRNKLNALTPGQNGYVYVLDAEGNFLVHPFAEGENWSDEGIINQIKKNKTGIKTYSLKRDNRTKIVAYDYFEGFDVYIASAVPVKDETGRLIRDLVTNSILIGLLIILVFATFVYFITTENVRRFLDQLETSSKQLKSTQEALKQSEGHFQTLFNNSSDDIYVIDFNGKFLEVNQVACDNLGYTRDELLSMNIRDVKTDNLKEKVDETISMIQKFGRHRYESENVSKNGKITPVEMKSRVINFRGQQVIMTIARDISERKEIEDKILTTIIQTEEKERKRIAADLHDDLGPILSTVKLYTDLLKNKTSKKMSSEEAVKNIEELVDMAITSTRTISRNIRPNILQDFGLAAAVNDFCTFINKTESINIDLDINNYNFDQRGGIEESILYQAVKELINNTIRHASASSIRIEIKNFDNQIIVYYKDNGKGFDLKVAMEQNSGLGLHNIINKIKSVKGTVDISSDPGEGMFMIASVRVADKNTINKLSK